MGKRILLLIIICLAFAIPAKAAKAPVVSFVTVTENMVMINCVASPTRQIFLMKPEGAKSEKPDTTAVYNKATEKLSFKNGKFEFNAKNEFVFLESAAENTSFSIEDLKPATKYSLEIYIGKNKFDFPFATLAPEPKVQALMLAFKNVDDKSISLTWRNGNGSNRIVVVSRESEPQKPMDGVDYIASSTYGDAKSRIAKSESYVVYKGKENSAKVTGLGPGKFFFQVFEFNGESQAINYNIQKGKQNPRTKNTALQAPNALPPSDLIDKGFTANWTPVGTAISYELQISSTKDFSKLVPPYDGMDVGALNKMEVIELPAGTYYYRVSAISKDLRSGYSNIVEIEIK